MRNTPNFEIFWIDTILSTIYLISNIHTIISVTETVPKSDSVMLVCPEEPAYNRLPAIQVTVDMIIDKGNMLIDMFSGFFPLVPLPFDGWNITDTALNPIQSINQSYIKIDIYHFGPWSLM